MKDRQIKIAAVGDNCIDAYDKTGEVYPGGNPVNVAVYTVRLGGQASYVGVVGDDEYGIIMKEAIAKKGVDISHVKTLPGATAVTHVEIIDGERILGEYDEGVMAEFLLSRDDIDFLAAHDLVVSGLWGMIEKDLPAIKAAGTKVAFDFATKYEGEIVDTAIPYVDYAFFAWDETAKEEAEEELFSFMRRMKERGAGMVIVTRGEQGSVVYDGKDFITFGIIPCDVVDTMGAGDSYIAGFLLGILEGKSIKECMEKGAANSSVTIGYKGAWE